MNRSKSRLKSVTIFLNADRCDLENPSLVSSVTVLTNATNCSAYSISNSIQAS